MGTLLVLKHYQAELLALTLTKFITFKNIINAMKDKIDSILNILFWASLAVLFLWIVAKLTRIIETPLYYEIIPFIALGFSAGMAYSRLSYKVGHISDRQNRIAIGLMKLENKVGHMEQNFNHKFDKIFNKLKIK